LNKNAQQNNEKYLTSPFFGGSTVTFSTFKGSFGAHATAALHMMGDDVVLMNLDEEENFVKPHIKFL
jgi:hypothetical protein